MRFLIDECVGPTVTRWLRREGHDVCAVFEEARGATDDTLVRKASREHRILVTNDKDFGEQVFREGAPHGGVVLLRLQDERPLNQVRKLRHLLQGYADRLTERFTVVTEAGVRFAGNRPGHEQTED